MDAKLLVIKPINYAPVALFVYNRPWHTRQTVEALLLNHQSKESDLYIFSDAPRNEAAREAVEEVRGYIKQVSGFNKVSIIERDANWGLANSVINGVTILCNEFGRVIVLEDDLVVSPNFLEFMNSGLAKYEFDEKVMQIAGYMFPVEIEISDDALFMPLTSSWGWATWKRAWEQFDASASSYNMLKNNKKVKYDFDLQGKYPYFKMLEAYKRNQVQSWAIRWYLSVFVLNGLVLYPKTTLVENVGFDGSGVNCIASEFPRNPFDPDFIVKKFPHLIEVSTNFFDIVKLTPKTKVNFKSYVKILWKAFKVI
ncbi:MAG: glycosyltransferase [Methylophilaceae bacterium]|nr:glycosyltransferase [Methylophilaceae bacterium]